MIRYGIRLERMKEEHIELVRQWRNSKEVQRFMQYKEEITTQMQSRWFASISNANNSYALIYYQDEPIGMTNLKDINYAQQCAEAGIFIAQVRYFDTDIPVRASLCGLDWNFENLALKKIFIVVSRENYRAIKFNKALGFEMLAGEEHKTFQRYVITKPSYYQHRNKLIKLLWN